MATTPPDVNLVRTGPRGGTPVLLLHPAGLDLTYWGDQIAALSAHYDTVALDLPGHGLTPGTAQDWVLDSLAHLVASVLESLEVGAVHVVGMSLGGFIAQALALGHPDVVASLTLVDTSATFVPAGRDAMRQRAAAAREHGMAAVIDATLERWITAGTRARRPDLVQRLTTTLLADDPTVHAALWDMLAGLDRVADLPRISAPTLVVVGEDDSSSPVPAAVQLRDGIPGARLRVVPDAAHLAALERPDVVSGHLIAFLAEVA